MRNLRNIRTFLCGMLATALLMGLVGPAVAASHVNKQLYYNDIKVRLNGKVLDLKDANGKKVEPFIIDGTTYLPVRAVGEALGLNVSWDGATQTVVLGNDPVKGQPAAWLGEMETFTGSAKETKVERGQHGNLSTANSGDTFDRFLNLGNIKSSNVPIVASYLLKGQYSKFTGTLYLPEAKKNCTGGCVLKVYLDETLVYTSPTIVTGVLPVELDIDVSGAYKMELEMSGWLSDASLTYQGSSYTPSIGNAALWT